MHGVKQRQGFLVSAVIHLTVVMILLAHTPQKPGESGPSELERKHVVFLPPPEVLRQLAPSPAARPRAAVPTPPPQAADPAKKDRISVGPPSELRSKGPMILRRDDDLTKVPKGQPMRPPLVAPTPRPAAVPTPGPRVARQGEEIPEAPGRQGFRVPPGLLEPPQPQGDDGQRKRPAGIGESVESAVDDMTRRLTQSSRFGVQSGTGQNLGGLYFDPHGADFTVWINDFKNQIYRNWMIPQAAYFGYGGHADFEFTLERDGSMSALRMLKSSGTSSLDRAARNSLTSSRFKPLPDDYGPPRVTMQVTFHYGPPRDS